MATQWPLIGHLGIIVVFAIPGAPGKEQFHIIKKRFLGALPLFVSLGSFQVANEWPLSGTRLLLQGRSRHQDSSWLSVGGYVPEPCVQQLFQYVLQG